MKHSATNLFPKFQFTLKFRKIEVLRAFTSASSAAAGSTVAVILIRFRGGNTSIVSLKIENSKIKPKLSCEM